LAAPCTGVLSDHVGDEKFFHDNGGEGGIPLVEPERGALRCAEESFGFSAFPVRSSRSSLMEKGQNCVDPDKPIKFMRRQVGIFQDVDLGVMRKGGQGIRCRRHVF